MRIITFPATVTRPATAILPAMAILAAMVLPAAARERVVCTVVAEIGTSAPLVREGNCDERISPASTFKIAIGLMAFDAGILTSPDQPELPFREGYADWNPKWRKATTPASWMRDSVVWFSQRATERLGPKRFAAYVQAFDYGNRDVSGDRGKANGLTNAWLSSSLQISPEEQVAFLTRMLAGKLPVDPEAVQQTRKLLESEGRPAAWRVFGKTGAGLPFGGDGELLRGQPFGWYVGWTETTGRTVVFARLVRFDERPGRPPGAIAREGLTEALFGPGGALD